MAVKARTGRDLLSNQDFRSYGRSFPCLSRRGAFSFLFCSHFSCIIYLTPSHRNTTKKNCHKSRHFVSPSHPMCRIFSKDRHTAILRILEGASTTLGGTVLWFGFGKYSRKNSIHGAVECQELNIPVHWSWSRWLPAPSRTWSLSKQCSRKGAGRARVFVCVAEQDKQRAVFRNVSDDDMNPASLLWALIMVLPFWFFITIGIKISILKMI